jgi:hypothetical protein
MRQDDPPKSPLRKGDFEDPFVEGPLAHGVKGGAIFAPIGFGEDFEDYGSP